MIATTVTLAEYLGRTYEPDCDFVDGVLEQRNTGQKVHSKTQVRLAAWFYKSKEPQFAVFPVMRIRVAQNRYRVADLVVTLLPEPAEQVFTEAPYLCVEVLSPDDSFAHIQNRVQDYWHLGVANIWVVDPELRKVWRWQGQGLTLLEGEAITTIDGRVNLPLREIFED